MKKAQQGLNLLGGVGFERVAIWFGMVAVSPAIAWIPQLFSILQSQGVPFPKARL